MRWLLVLALLAAAGCSSAGEKPAAPPSPPPPPTYELGTVTQLVPLDATDDLTLPEEVGHVISTARAKIPERVDAGQVKALEDLESRYERLEANLEGATLERDRARLLGAYYWERLRLFSPDLAPEPPDAMLSAFERATARGD